MRVILLALAVVICGIATLTPAVAQNSCPTPANLPTCSYSATNGNCSVSINRMNAVTPPTIYVKRGCSVTVSVTNPSPLEDLTLDWKSSATVIPPDTFQTLLTPLSGNLGKFTAIELIRAPSGGPLAETIDLSHCETDPTNCDNAPTITKAQERVMSAFQEFDPPKVAHDGLLSIKTALQPPPSVTGKNLPPWYNAVAWRTDVAAQLQVAASSAKQKEFGFNLEMLASELADFKKTHTDPKSVSKAGVMDKNQASLNTAYDNFRNSLTKLDALQTAVKAIPDSGSDIAGNALIQDITPGDKNYETQTWVVNYTNKLMPTAKRVVAESLKSENAVLLSGLADPSPKTPLVTITVQFQSPSRFEVSTGLMVPLTPYHSYGKAAVAKNGVVTDNIVQETKTYTVVPAVFVNYLLGEWIPNKQRSAVFASGGVGYNPTSSSVEFGAGMTYSYRSIAVSFVADIGRDTKLTGGFTVGQSLGTGNAANPPTSTYWSVKPSFAVSVRIPLGGSSTSK
jgi:hypothetical protein